MTPHNNTHMAFLNGPSYLALPRPENIWVVQDFIPLGGAANLYGEAKAGKSFLALQLGIAVASGQPDWMGFPIHNHGPVLFLQMDTARNLWMEQYIESAQSDGQDISNIYFTDRDDPEIPYPFDMRRAGGEWVKREVERIKPILVIVDVWREIFEGDENSSEVCSQVWAALQNTCKGASLLILAHEVKGGVTSEGKVIETPLRKGARGSTFVAGKVDGIAKLQLSGKLHYVSRTAQEAKIQLKRKESGFWELDHSSVDAQATTILQNAGTKSKLQLARELASVTGLTVEAARSKLRRLSENPSSGGQTHDQLASLLDRTI